MDKPARPPRDTGREASGDGVKRGAILGGKGHPAGFQSPLAEVVNLPREQLFIKGPAPDNRAVRELMKRLLSARQIPHRDAINGLFLLGLPQEEMGERVVPEILDDEPLSLATVREDARDPYPVGGQQFLDFHEGPALANPVGLVDLVRASRIRDKKSNRAPGGGRWGFEQQAKELPGRSPAGHGLGLPNGPCARDLRDQRREGREIDVRQGVKAMPFTHSCGKYPVLRSPRNVPADGSQPEHHSPRSHQRADLCSLSGAPRRQR